MRDDPIAALVMGIDVTRYTALTFGVGAAYAAIAGALAALLLDFIAPRASPTGSRSSFWWARCSAA